MGSSLKDLYSSKTKEISLRDEFNTLETGSSIETPKFRDLLLRIMRKDVNGKLIPCECTDKLTREPDKDIYCPVCMGEGFKWDETWDVGYRWMTAPKEVLKPAGLSNIPLVLFYAEYDRPLTNNDKIVEVNLDLEGKPEVPTKRSGVYKIQHVESLRLDNGRVEFLKIWTYKEDVKSLGK